MGAWTATQIWKKLDRPAREEAALSLWADGSLNKLERLQALAPWLAARGMRTRFLDQMPKKRRASLIAEGGLPEETASQILISHHLVNRRPLLAGFLDGLGVPHEEGLIDPEAEVDPPDASQVKKALEGLGDSFPEEQRVLYLRTLTATDPIAWAAVAELIDGPE